MASDKGFGLDVDMTITPIEWVRNYYTGSDEKTRVASKGILQFLNIPEEAQLKASIENEHAEEVVMKEGIGWGSKLPVSSGSQLKTPVENEQPVEAEMKEDMDCGGKSPVLEGAQLTPRSNEHEASRRIEPREEVAMEEDDVGCGDKLPDSHGVTTCLSRASLTPSSLASVISSNHF